MKMKVIIPLIILLTITAGCDDIFDTWFNTPADERDVEWKLVDGPMGAVSDPNMDASMPWLGVRDGNLFAAWVTNGIINFYRYNGDDDNPAWTFESDFIPGTPYNLSFCIYNNAIIFAYYNGMEIYVSDTYGNYYGGAVVTTSFTGPLKLTVYRGQIYLLWHDGYYIQISRYNQPAGAWESGMGDIYGINDVDTIVNRFQAAIIDDFLYVTFISDMNIPLIPNDALKVRRYDGTGWTTILNELNFYSGAGYANFPAITGFHNEAVVAWTEYNAGYRLCVRKASNGEWLDGGYDNYPGLSWSGNTYNYIQMTSLTTVNGNLCLMWVEDIPDPLLGYNQSIRVSVYKEKSDTFIKWDDITGGGSTGLNILPGLSAMAPFGIEYHDKLYVAFLESNPLTYLYNLHVKVAR